MEAIASRLESLLLGWRLEAIGISLEALAGRLEAVASRLEAIPIVGWRPLLAGWKVGGRR